MKSFLLLLIVVILSIGQGCGTHGTGILLVYSIITMLKLIFLFGQKFDLKIEGLADRL
jgi:hypothetical protein